jgi:hypothetical protein
MAKKNTTPELVRYRHGDIILDLLPEGTTLPENLTVKPDRAAAYGEITGHAHRLGGEGEVLKTSSDNEFAPLFIRAGEGAGITHEEHKRIAFPKGCILRVTKKRAYNPDGGWTAVVD